MDKIVLPIPENMILELLKGKTVNMECVDGVRVELKPQTEGVYLTREEYMGLQNDALTHALGMIPGRGNKNE